MALTPRLEWLGSWWGQSLLLVAALLFFVWATRLEQAREQETASRIYRPGGSFEGKIGLPPPKLLHRWHWAKVGVAILVLGLMGIGGASVYRHYKLHKPLAQNQPLATNPRPEHPDSNARAALRSGKAPGSAATQQQRGGRPSAHPQAEPVSTQQASATLQPPPQTGATAVLPANPTTSPYEQMVQLCKDVDEEEETYSNSAEAIPSQQGGGYIASHRASHKPMDPAEEQRILNSEASAYSNLAVDGDLWIQREQDTLIQLHKAAVAFMESNGSSPLTPNQVSADALAFNDAMRLADVRPRPEQFIEGKFDGSRFKQLASYCNLLRNKLANYPYSHP